MEAVEMSGHDRSDLHIGILIVLFAFPDLAANWDEAIYDLDLGRIDSSGYALEEFRRFVPRSTITDQALISAGQKARTAGVAKTSHKVRLDVKPGRSAEFYCRYKMADALAIEHIGITNSRSRSAALWSQGVNTCAFDAALFLTASFNFFRHQIDAISLGSIKDTTPTQLAVRIIQLNVGTPSLNVSNADCLASNNRMRDKLMKTMSQDCLSIKAGEYNDIGDVAGYMWNGIPSLSYTWAPMWTCCGKHRIEPENNRLLVRTGHSIELVEKSHGSAHERMLDLSPLSQQIAAKFFPETDEYGNVDSEYNMVVPFDVCGEEDCRQLPTRSVRIVDRLPPFLQIAVDGGSPISNDTHHHYDKVAFFAWIDERQARCKADYELVGVGIYDPRRHHFVARVVSPAGFPEFKGKTCHFDGMQSPQVTELSKIKTQSKGQGTHGRRGILHGLPLDFRVAQLVYRLKACIECPAKISATH